MVLSTITGQNMLCCRPPPPPIPKQERREKKPLATGRRSVVYGPYSSRETETEFETYTGKRLPRLSPHLSYILKIHPSVKKPLTTTYETVWSVQNPFKECILVPLYMAKSLEDGKWVEVQRYGGVDMWYRIQDLTWEWTEDMLWSMWNSIHNILSVGLVLIQEEHLFLADVKLENMVWSAQGLSLIDVEWSTLDAVYQRNIHDLIFTPHPFSVPPEFFRLFPQPHECWDRYSCEWDQEMTDLNVASLQDLEKKTPLEWSLDTVRRMALFCLFYPLVVLWKLLFVPSLTTTDHTRILYRMTSVMNLVMTQREHLDASNILRLMNMVRLEEFPTIWNEYIQGYVENVEEVWVSERQILFPRPKILIHQVLENYFF